MNISSAPIIAPTPAAFDSRHPSHKHLLSLGLYVLCLDHSSLSPAFWLTPPQPPALSLKVISLRGAYQPPLPGEPLHFSKFFGILQGGHYSRGLSTICRRHCMGMDFYRFFLLGKHSLAWGKSLDFRPCLPPQVDPFVGA